jgi:hypothetical protein
MGKLSQTVSKRLLVAATIHRLVINRQLPSRSQVRQLLPFVPLDDMEVKIVIRSDGLSTSHVSDEIEQSDDDKDGILLRKVALRVRTYFGQHQIYKSFISLIFSHILNTHDFTHEKKAACEIISIQDVTEDKKKKRVAHLVLSSIGSVIDLSIDTMKSGKHVWVTINPQEIVERKSFANISPVTVNSAPEEYLAASHLVTSDFAGGIPFLDPQLLNGDIVSMSYFFDIRKSSGEYEHIICMNGTRCELWVMC